MNDTVDGGSGQDLIMMFWGMIFAFQLVAILGDPCMVCMGT